MFKFVLLTVLALSSAKLADDLVMIEDSAYGRSLLNLVEANLGTENAFQVILDALAELDADLVAQQKEDDELWFNQRQPECETLIAQYEADVDAYHTEMTRAEAAYKAAEVAMNQAIADANQKTGEIASLEDDLVNFDSVWTTDNLNADARQKDHEEALAATREAIAIMEGLIDGSEAELLQMPAASNEMLVQVKALAAVGMELGADQGAVAKIIGMLENIANNLESAINAEGVSEVDAESHYKTVKFEMERTLGDLQEALDHLNNVIADQKVIYNNELAAYNEASGLWEDAKGKLAAKRAECELWETEYNNNLAKRNEERAIIAQVVALFEDYPESEFAAYFDARNQDDTADDTASTEVVAGDAGSVDVGTEFLQF